MIASMLSYEKVRRVDGFSDDVWLGCGVREYLNDCISNNN